jgi:hypothetical protein
MTSTKREAFAQSWVGSTLKDKKEAGLVIHSASVTMKKKATCSSDTASMLNIIT